MKILNYLILSVFILLIFKSAYDKYQLAAHTSEEYEQCINGYEFSKDFTETWFSSDDIQKIRCVDYD